MLPGLYGHAVCTMHCRSICPVPFLPRLITMHTSTAASIANKLTDRMGGRWADSAFMRDQMTQHLLTIATLRNSDGQFSENSTHKDCREHCKTPRWQCWFNGSQPSRFGGHNNTIKTCQR